MRPFKLKTMKKFGYIIILALVMTSGVSCKKFLTVNPKTEMPQDVLFSTESGFKDALTGVYIQLKGSSVYGRALSYSTIEYLVSSWDTDAGSWQKKIGEFDYNDETVQNNLSSIFGAEYKVIASLNAILDKIDQQKSVFTTPGMYEMIKSECLALRAYCHLDLIRLFGPIPTDPSNGNELAYVKQLSNQPNDHISYEAYKAALMQDLKDAAALSENVDPILTYSLSELRNLGVGKAFNPTDDYVGYRYLRMNYYAIKALEARANLWYGDKDQAYGAAKEVIDATNEDGTPKFRLGQSSDFADKDYSLIPEQIFGLYDFDMFDTYTNNFASGSFKKSTSATVINTQLYGNTGTDIRETSLWNVITLSNQAKCYVIRKYEVVESPTSLNADFKQIPMLRISEMYLIAAETAPVGAAQQYWDSFRLSRNLDQTALPDDQTLKTQAILKEYRKEFYAEGQAFFAYKRVNAPKSDVIFAPTTVQEMNYLIPMPKNESVN